MAARNDVTRMPEPPEGWPVGSYDAYGKAQQAVDALSDLGDFPVEDVTIVGVDLMQVERVVGRLTWGKVLGGGVLYGMWLGLFFGLLMGVFTEEWLPPLVTGVVVGAAFGVVAAAVPYAMQKGRRDFASTTQIVAGRYDVLCKPRSAERARDVLARRSIR